MRALYDKILQVVNRFDFSRLPFQTRVNVNIRGEHNTFLGACVQVSFVMLVIERDTGHSCPLMDGFTLAYDLHEEMIVDYIKRTVINMIRHETLENLYYDGERRWDPHARGR